MAKKREGYVMIVLILLFMVLPAIIMVASSTTGNFKSIINNRKYHQEELIRMSVKEIGLKGVEEAVLDINLLVKQETTVVSGVLVKGAYYIEETDNIDMTTIEGFIEGKEAIKDKLEISVLTVDNIIIDSNYPSGKMELPYDVVQKVKFDLNTEGLFGLFEQAFIVDVNYTIDVGADGLIVVRDVSIIG